MANKNFKWLIKDIDNTLFLKIVYKKDDNKEVCYSFNVLNVLETTGDKLEVKTANINDLFNFLSFGIVRFVNIVDRTDVIDIPFKKLYLLYKNAYVLGGDVKGRTTSFKELDVFSVIDGVVQGDILVYSSLISRIPDELNEVMKIAYEFDGYGMHEKFDAMNKITLINHRRLMADRLTNN